MRVFDDAQPQPWSEKKLAIISGLSNPRSCLLSQTQLDFLESLSIPGYSKIFLNFPYLPDGNLRVKTDASPSPIAASPPGLIRASYSNFSQFMAMRWGKRMRAGMHRHWRSVTSSCKELTLIALSCGLEIVNRCIPETAEDCNVQVIALGPVAWEIPRVPCLMVRGSNDYISQIFFRNVDVLLPGVGHLEYFQLPHTRELVLNHLCSSTSES